MSQTEKTLIECTRLTSIHPGYSGVAHIVIASPGMSIDQAALKAADIAWLTELRTYLLFNDILVFAEFEDETNAECIARFWKKR